MSNIFRLALMLALVLFVALAAALQQPEWARDLGLDEARASVAAVKCLFVDDPEWSAPNRSMIESSAAKNRTTLLLIDGRLTLFEAAAHFRLLNRPQMQVALPRLYPGDSEEERLCWQVIADVRTVSESLGQNATELIARLEEDLRQHKERHGRVILPTEPLSTAALDGISLEQSGRI